MLCAMEAFDGANVRFALLVSYLASSAFRDRLPGVSRHWTKLLAVLVAIGLLSYIALVRVQSSSGVVHLHQSEVYHYYIGTKYFAELGHDGLYEATVIADFEDDRSGHRPRAPVRDLKGGSRETTRGELVQRRAQIKRRFPSAERWRQFKADIALLRGVDVPGWRSTEFQRDHGYNGTPLTTVLLGSLAAWSPGGPQVFLRAAVWLDVLLILALGGWISSRLGWNAGLSFGFFWLVNPFNDYDFTGGSYLRYNYFIALAMAIVFYRVGRRVATGICLAFASLFRVFPVMFPIGLIIHDLLSPQRWARLRDNAWLYGAGALAAAAVIGATSYIATPAQTNPWLEQLEIVAARNSVAAPNTISLRFPFLYGDEHNVAVVTASVRNGEEIDWPAETTATFEDRKPLYYAALVVWLMAAMGCARRMRGAQAFVLGIVFSFGMLLLSHYYFCMLSLLSLIFAEQRRVLEALGLGMLIVVGTGWLGPVVEIIDLRYAVYSVEVLALLIGVLALIWTGVAGSLKREAPVASS